MNLKSMGLLALIAATALQAQAANIDAGTAQGMTNNFLKHQVATKPGKFNAMSLTDLKLAHAEVSRTVNGAYDYYAFNLTGGGFIIVAGEDRANHVLGYSDSGHLDFSDMPDNLKALLASYKEEIEWLQSHPEINVTPAVRAAAGNGVDPLIKSNWGQEMPYNLQCPIYQGEYCVVGCVATAMSQVMHYWRYPSSSPQLSSYYCYDINQTVPSLPSTSFDYNKMLLSTATGIGICTSSSRTLTPASRRKKWQSLPVTADRPYAWDIAPKAVVPTSRISYRQ